MASLRSVEGGFFFVHTLHTLTMWYGGLLTYIFVYEY